MKWKDCHWIRWRAIDILENVMKLLRWKPKGVALKPFECQTTWNTSFYDFIARNTSSFGSCWCISYRKWLGYQYENYCSDALLLLLACCRWWVEKMWELTRISPKLNKFSYTNFYVFLNNVFSFVCQRGRSKEEHVCF